MVDFKAFGRPTVVSLFAGCGGLDIGFKEAGYDLIYACDNDPAAVEVYKRNIDERAFVRDVTSVEFHDDIASLGSCDVVLGGFPCQGFSKAGPKKHDDIRNLLYLEMRQAVSLLRPKIFLAENVDGLSQNFKGSFLDAIIKDFRDVGYRVEFRIHDSLTFGVPQHRRRIYFVGVREDLSPNFDWPEPTHAGKVRNGESVILERSDLLGLKAPVLPLRSIKDAVEDLLELSVDIPDHKITNAWDKGWYYIFEKIGPGQKLCNVRHSPTSVYTWQIPEYFGSVDEAEKLILETIARNRRHKRYGSIPNGNPLSIDVIRELSGISELAGSIESLLLKGYLKEVDGKYDLKGAMFCSGLFKRPEWDMPCSTVLTNFHNPRYFLHPIKNRPFSLRECARLQGFPDDFIFTLSTDVRELTAGYRLVGNAVSPPVGRAFANAIAAYLGKETHIETSADFAHPRREVERV
ncbi:DNA cytosine methyltransferase [Pseudomonas sp. PDM12]|uniref:DNA cytosine methyltransferase n=1 Tax=Pseudomonas sp. PDM12 TaxID=2769260 RepID=UPI00177DE787|nr:DNA cytosine methyltransferase [Pseudomonas sp. PDM12]MBD9653762.1 DNA cytosine methyltransferase [Pseudomonas sp. PDM12]